jgi:hypothetical protein
MWNVCVDFLGNTIVGTVGKCEMYIDLLYMYAIGL